MRKLDEAIPIGVLVYYNVVLATGVESFFKQAKAAGIDGVLIADLPIESAEEVLPYAKANDVDLIFIVSPVTTDERLQRIATSAGGFIYLVSRLGVTGTDKSAGNLTNLGGLILSLIHILHALLSLVNQPKWLHVTSQDFPITMEKLVNSFESVH